MPSALCEGFVVGLMTPLEIILAIVFFCCLWRHWIEPGYHMFHGPLLPYSIVMWVSFILFVILLYTRTIKNARTFDC
jgi:hypothetical protein